MPHRFIIGALALFAMVATTAHAQQRPPQIKLSAKKAFKHKHGGIEVPPTMAGIARSGITALEQDHLDVYVRFEAPDDSEAITVYVYRKVGGSLPVWFDRARQAIEGRSKLYGTPRRVEGALSFTPPGRTNAAGLIAAYAPSAGPFKSTGVAMAPLGEWLVKVRYSSTTVPPEEMPARIRGVLDTLKWPTKLADAPAATLVEPCTTPLLTAERSQPVAANGAVNLAGALQAMPGLSSDEESRNPAATWCRDDGAEPAGSIYRRDGSTDSYLIAISDAGRGVRVYRDTLGPEIDPSVKPSWRIEMLELSQTTAFASQDRLPPPSQAIEIVQNDAYVTRTGTWGKKIKVDVNSSTFK